jgi:hypothetical protein
MIVSERHASINRLRSSACTLFAWEIVLEKIPIKRQLSHYYHSYFIIIGTLYIKFFCNMSVDTTISCHSININTPN